jgi:hypothetical protein
MSEAYTPVFMQSVGRGGEAPPRKSWWLARSTFAPTKGVEVTLSAATTSRKVPNIIEEGATTLQ